MVRVRDIIKFGRVNFKLSALHCDQIDPIYNGTCYKPPQKSVNVKSGSSKSKKNLEHSVDAVSHAGNDLTEMNLVNDVTGTNSIMLANDQSTLTLNVANNNGLSQNQILLD